MRPKKHGLSPAQLAWAIKFKCLAQQSKTPDPRAFNDATERTKESGWYYRDMIHAAMSGSLILDGESLKVSTPTARVYRNAAQNMTNGSGAYLTPDLKNWDTNVFWSPTVNPSRLTIRSAGLYLVGAHLYYNAISGGRRDLGIVVNRTTWMVEEFQTAASANAITINASTIWYFNAGDYVEVWSFVNANGVTARIGGFWIMGIDPTTNQ